MKTKIIYISGSEVFDIADIRAAFDEVRTVLALDKETVLFGVPVDNDDAFAKTTVSETSKISSEKVVEPVVLKELKPVTENIEPDIAVSVIDDAPEIEKPIEKPKKSVRHSRAKVVPIAPVDATQNETVEPENATDEKPAIPILSVLGAKPDIDIINDDKPIDIMPIEPDSEPDAQIIPDETQSVSITDMLADDAAPVDKHEKTLEELLESMTPLGEDEKIVSQPIAKSESEIDPEPAQTPNEDSDATLQLLATEFAESADKIVAPAKTETRGKIGKLKNILPFKKAKRDDSGIMGDLFGWAGVANDEDFTIPGFFANASSKK